MNLKLEVNVISVTGEYLKTLPKQNINKVVNGQININS